MIKKITGISVKIALIVFMTAAFFHVTKADAASEDTITVRSGDFIFSLDSSRWADPFMGIRSVSTYKNTVTTGTTISFVSLGHNVKYSENSLVTCVDLVSGILGYDDHAVLGDPEFDQPGEIDTRPYVSLTDCVTGKGTHYASYYLLKGIRSNTFAAAFSDDPDMLKETDKIVRSAKCTGLSGKTRFSVKEVISFYKKGKDTSDIRMKGKIYSTDKKRQCAVFKYKNKKLRVYLGYDVSKVKKGEHVLVHLYKIQKDSLDKKNLWTGGYVLKHL